MGTRHLTMVVKDEKPVVAQYGQWDGYPSGAGLFILKFLKKRSLKKFKKKVDLVRFSNEKDVAEVEAFMKSIGVNDGWMDMDQADKYHRAYPFLTRDNGSGILQMIHDNNDPIFLTDSSEFTKDSLFCEWAYVIDLDKETLEVYEGFNQRPLDEDERFYSPGDLPKEVADSRYYPVRWLKTYSLSDLPTPTQFLEECEVEEEEEF